MNNSEQDHPRRSNELQSDASPHRRRVVLVAGMHRSGTSAVARVLSLLGGVLPRHVMPAHETNNAAGFWEPEKVVTIHEELLESAGSSWQDAAPLPASWFASEAARTCASRLKQCLLDEYGERDLAIVKDPRLCRLLPLWLPLLESIPAEPLFVLPYRHPLEVASSLATRDRFPRQKSLLLWLQHLLLAEEHTRGRRRAIVSYASLLDDPRRTVERLTAALGLQWPVALDDALPEIRSFLTDRLRHSASSERGAVEIDEPSGWVARVHQILDSGGEPSPTESAELDAIRERYLEAVRLVGPWVSDLEAKLGRQGGSPRAEVSVRGTPGRGGPSSSPRDSSEQEERSRADHRARSLHAESEARYRALLDHLEQETTRALSFRSEMDVLRARHQKSEAEKTELQSGLSETKGEVERLRVELARLRAGGLAVAEPEARDGGNGEPPPAPAAREPSATRAHSSFRRHLSTGLTAAKALLGRTREHRPLFDPGYYLAHHPSAARFWGGPALHFVLYGAAANLSPHRLFDPHYYLQQNPAVGEAGIAAFEHYIRTGASEGLSPHPLFDPSFYLRSHPEAADGADPLAHFLAGSSYPHQSPHPLFDCEFYRSQNADVARSDGNPLLHYLRQGAAEGKNPHPLFDTTYYVSRYPQVAESGLNPLEHFVLRGAARGYSPHPLFDLPFYTETVGDLRGVNPLVHFLEVGAAEGHAPHPLFDTRYYLEKNPDVAEERMNPLVHYVRFGAVERRSFHPLFDVALYLENVEGLPDERDVLVDFIHRADHDTLQTHRLFDGVFYLQENDAVRHTGMSALVHFIRYGAAAGLKPHPLFDTAYYLRENAEVLRSGVNPLVHYLEPGAAQRRDPSPLFQTSYYLSQLERDRLSDGASEENRAEPFERRGPSDVPEAYQAKATKQFYVFTSVSLNYLPKARVLMDTLKRHHPAVHFCLLVNEPVPRALRPSLEPFDEVREVEQLPIENVRSWIFKHDLVELCTATKGFLLHELLMRSDCEAVLYFDPDVALISEMTPILEALDRRSVVLTPHLTAPESTLEAVVDNEMAALKHGVFNLGFLGVKPTAEGKRFARWWKDRLEHFCYVDIPSGLFTDQRWADFVPVFFEDCEILRHPGCNVATWNLAQRRVEGSFGKGFTVDGEPLVFYHFSGFDSGAQETMLKKYARSMPAAFELRRWYIEQTERAGAAELSKASWRYGHFSDGEPISAAHRRAYRDDPALQTAFPDPFEGGVDFRDRLRGERKGGAGPARETTADLIGTETPLVHYLREGRHLGLKPNPFFDPGYYVTRYPDIESAGLEPLAHFVTAGWRERRAPSRQFDIDFYVAQLESRGIEDVNPLEHYLTEGRSTGFRPNPWYARQHDRSSLELLKRQLTDAPVILHMCHSQGGGTERHIRDLSRLIAPRAHSLRLAPSRSGQLELEPLSPRLKLRLRFDPRNQLDDLVDVLREVGVSRLHIHHTLGSEAHFERIVSALGLPFDFTLHDYYVLSPSPHLVGPEGCFVGEDLSRAERALLSNDVSGLKPESLARWQEERRWLVDEAERVIVPSSDVRARLEKHLSGVEPIVAPHWEPGEPQPPRLEPLGTNEPMRIALVGELSRSKGGDVVAAVARLLTAHPGLAALSLLGFLGDEINEVPGLSETGRYDEEELQSLIEAHRPHLIWYPVVCPETYSYTMSAGLRSGRPLVVSSLGALPERVRGRMWTWVRPWWLEPEDWVALFKEIRTAHLETGISPEPTPGSPPESSFYPDGYLEPIDATRTATGARAGADGGTDSRPPPKDRPWLTSSES